jgi:hypothetical protein
MRDLAKSVISLSWAMPFLVARQAARMVSAPAAAARSLPLDAAAGRALRAGARLQQSALGSLLDAGGWAQAAADFLARPGEAWRFFLPGEDGGAVRRELCNKVEVYLLVTGSAERLGIPAAPPFPLAELVDRAFALGAFRALWALEGLGLEYVDGLWRDGAPPPHAAFAGLPERSLIMLHAGMGMAFGQRILGALPGGATAAEVRRAARDVVSLGRGSSRPGYAGAALEAVGLVARTLHPRLVQPLGEALAEADGDAASYFWHGVGRALYFLPVNFLPCGNTLWRAFELAAAEATHELARRNAFAGLAWAVALVNQRHPEVVADLLRDHGAELDALGALAAGAAGAGVVSPFADGVAAAAVLRQATTPDAPFLAAFCGYRPAGAGAVVARWDDLVRRPCREALERSYPTLRRTGLGAIFRCGGVFTGESPGERPGGRG